MTQIKLQLRYILPLWFVLLITNWLPDNRITIRIRGFMASPFFKKCGKRLTLGRNLTILNSNEMCLGNDIYIANGGWFNALGGLELEDEVVFGPYVIISTLQHTFANFSVKQGGSIADKVKIGKGSWLASHVSVKCGVEIGKGNLIAANSFVSRSTDNYKILGGVPAKVIKDVVNTKADFYSKSDIIK